MPTSPRALRRPASLRHLFRPFSPGPFRKAASHLGLFARLIHLGLPHLVLSRPAYPRPFQAWLTYAFLQVCFNSAQNTKLMGYIVCVFFTHVFHFSILYKVLIKLYLSILRRFRGVVDTPTRHPFRYTYCPIIWNQNFRAFNFRTSPRMRTHSYHCWAHLVQLDEIMRVKKFVDTV